MQFRSDGLPRSRLLRASGFASGVMLLAPIVFVGLETTLAAILDPAGLAVPDDAITVLDAVAIPVNSLTLVGPIALASAIAVVGASLYGTAWLDVDGPLELAFKAGGLALATVAGLTIVLALFWAFLEEGLAGGHTTALVGSAIALVAFVWIARRSVLSFRSGYRAPE